MSRYKLFKAASPSAVRRILCSFQSKCQTDRCVTIQGYNSSLHNLQGCFSAQKQFFVSLKQYLLNLTASSQGSGVFSYHFWMVLLACYTLFPTISACGYILAYVTQLWTEPPTMAVPTKQATQTKQAGKHVAITKLRLGPLVQSSMKQLDTTAKVEEL